MQASLLGTTGVNATRIVLVRTLLAGTPAQLYLQDLPPDMPEKELKAALAATRVVADVTRIAPAAAPSNGAAAASAIVQLISTADVEASIASLNGLVLSGGRAVRARRAAAGHEAQAGLQMLADAHEASLQGASRSGVRRLAFSGAASSAVSHYARI